ncbi:MAG: hypothetical protein JO112_01680 [Planctomycetes bacterium]|nr:hypothetical protein [Planctomycetota bacterium]
MAKAARPVTVLNPMFRLLLAINGAIFLLTFGTLVLLSCLAGEPLTKAQGVLLQVSEYLCTTTAGAFIGMLGGKAGNAEGVR